jgi:alpha-D-xyloside xylohydrolase
MEGKFQIVGQRLVWQCEQETVMIQPWGLDGVRVQATLLSQFQDLPHALTLEPQPSHASKTEINANEATLKNGKILVKMSKDGRLCFHQSESGEQLLAEPPAHFTLPPARRWRANGGGAYRLDVSFLPVEGEGFYGMGQHQHGRLDNKGCVIELEQRNTEVCIPFLVSNRGYGFLWNNPALGRAELGYNRTRWVADSTRQMDYYLVVGGDPAELLQRYAEVTGLAPLLPGWAAGFWQCKLRYKTQHELLEVAREYRRRGLPLSVIVIDFFHWTMQGEWKFDPQCWPDPAAMVKELDELGVKLMVSIWPTVNYYSENFKKMHALGYLVRSEQGSQVQKFMHDTYPGRSAPLTFYDATHPEARQFVWEQVRENYYNYGIKVWWLDADEPEIQPFDHELLHYHLGPALEVGCIYPLLHQQGFYEGMRAEGEEEIVTLSRSAWAGSQRYGAAVWSGDIASTFEVLRAQVTAGLNIAMSGIPWWTTDIGGFSDGDIQSPYFRELIVRWFQYGLFCPLFRLHGFRKDSGEPAVDDTGAPNEIWSFGDKAYGILKDLLFLRERLKPYILAQMKTAHLKGIPPMRPLFVDFPGDGTAWNLSDEFMLGPDLLVAPVLYQGALSREVYLPAHADWVDAWDGTTRGGGQWVEVNAPLDRVPAFWRKGSSATFLFGKND